MNKQQVLIATTDLKSFFEKKKLKVCEVREVLFRLVDYIDEFYDDEKLRDVPFTNGHNNNPYKEKILSK